MKRFALLLISLFLMGNTSSYENKILSNSIVHNVAIKNSLLESFSHNVQEEQEEIIAEENIEIPLEETAIVPSPEIITEPEVVIQNNSLTSLPQGTAGRLVLPDVGYEMPLYFGSSDSWSSIVDAANSALYSSFLGKVFIADHSYQGFSSMTYSSVGSVGYIVSGNDVKTIQCVSKYVGTNIGDTILINGNNIENMTDGYLFMYTCNDSTGLNVTVTFWNFV